MSQRGKRPFVASPDQVRITREPEGALIEYADPAVGSVSFRVRDEARGMTDQQILDRWNETVEAMEASRRTYEHVCREIPVGRPQLSFDERCGQWSPRGDVVRGVIDENVDAPEREPTVWIDGRAVSWSEFGAALLTFAGWGFRLYMVPDDAICDEPVVKVEDAEDD